MYYIRTALVSLHASLFWNDTSTRFEIDPIKISFTLKDSVKAFGINSCRFDEPLGVIAGIFGMYDQPRLNL
jgi:hypothetical protein